MSLIVCGLQIQRILWKNISQRKKATPFPEFRPHTQPSKDCLEATACMEKMKDNEVGWWIIYKGSWVQEIENWTCFGLNHKDIYWLMKLEVQCKVGFPVPCGSAAFSHFPTVLQALSFPWSGFMFRWVWRGCCSYLSHLHMVLTKTKGGSFWKLLLEDGGRAMSLLSLSLFSK